MLCFAGTLRRPDWRIILRHKTGFWEGWKFAECWKSIASGEGDRLLTESVFVMDKLTVGS